MILTIYDILFLTLSIFFIGLLGMSLQKKI